MKTYSGWEYLLIDVGNAYGLDKLPFEERIQWVESNTGSLEALEASADTKALPLYKKSVMALRKAQQGLPSGHMVALDASASGIQIMSVLTGCYSGAKATGLVDPDVRADAYTEVTERMRKILGDHFDVSRKDAKSALMTTFYGSKAEPKKIFGEDTPELNAFYEAAYEMAPGAWQLLQALLGSWRSGALNHSWKLPDGFDAVVKVMKEYTVEAGNAARIEVDELGHSSFTYEYAVNEGSKTGLSNAANLVHSCDGYVLRSMQRRCNYDEAMVNQAETILYEELAKRKLAISAQWELVDEPKVQYYIDQYTRSTVADVVILPYLTEANVVGLSTGHLVALRGIALGMLEYKPFPLMTIHDAFVAHPNNLNHVRQQYVNILAELADSNLLDDLLSQVYKQPVHFEKLSQDLSGYIRESEYAIC